jgi:L-rhamnose mutarotase
VKRFGNVVRIAPEQLDTYRALHRALWPVVQDTLQRCHIRHYAVYHKDGWLFSSYEYHGSDHAADMARMHADPAARQWWALTMPLHEPVDQEPPSAWWAAMDEVFRQD